MLERLRLRNFRGFDEHVVPLRKLTLIVGANNAGKSTIVEALRLVALVVNRFLRGTGNFVPIPEWLNEQEAFRGIQPSLGRRRGFEGHGPSTFHQYNDPPAAIAAEFSSGASVIVFVGPNGELHGIARDRTGAALGSARDARTLGLTPIAIQPQVAPLLRAERILEEETIERGEGTHLASQHFRNQLLLYDRHWRGVQEMAEATG